MKMSDKEAAKKNEDKFGHLKFDCWKWPTRKKMSEIQCRVLQKGIFDMWKWPRRKKGRGLKCSSVMIECGKGFVIKVEPQSVIKRSCYGKKNARKDNKVVYAEIQWTKWQTLQRDFLRFSLILEDKYHLKGNGLIRAKVFGHVTCFKCLDRVKWCKGLMVVLIRSHGSGGVTQVFSVTCLVVGCST